MNAEVKTKWLAALRSGEYKQVQGKLRRDDGYCCFGVLCELFAKEHSADCLGWEKVDADYYRFLPSASNAPATGSCTSPPKLVCDWAGVFSSVVNGVSLPKMNDCGDSFDQIADKIEAGL